MRMSCKKDKDGKTALDLCAEEKLKEELIKAGAKKGSEIRK